MTFSSYYLIMIIVFNNYFRNWNIESEFNCLIEMLSLL